MVLNDRFVMTDEEVVQQRKEALFAHEEARQQLDRLLLKAKTEAKRLYKVAGLLDGLEAEPDNPYRAETPLLTLVPSEYQDIVNMSTVRALANSIAAARRELAETADAKRKAGYLT